ncbi:MAG: bifunctional phosphopantothenoylcysteine decarboxylase/phosphopantothenate--cysteine ligase CoaBC [Bacillota bacterium]|nr:MAG: bifunctional phosphopantothenoylcysteine decarboxylase/phosphopantothenate--cysteine ligase CoaBC [Bacillota bacterium]
MLTGKTVLLGVSGGIAAYKAVAVCSQLVQRGAEVHVLMTAAATRFVTPLTFQAISGHPVLTDLLAEQHYGHVDHVHLAHKADLMVIAPATANLLARLAAGQADDPVTALALAVRCPVLVAPAMEPNMYAHPATQANIARLRQYGYHVLEPAEGRMASGRYGKGRLPEPDVIVAAAMDLLRPRDLAGRRVLVTAGPTREPLDPVRFLSNRSTGKMGYAIARAAAARGAEVVLVSGPTALPDPPGVQTVRVESAQEMHREVMAWADWLEVAVGAAAVADWRPAVYHEQKMKKQDGPLVVELVRTPDIMADLGVRKRPGQVLVAFAAETRDLESHARKKLESKNADLVVANDVTEPGSGFGTDTNRVRIYHRDGREEALPLLTKDEVAHAILDRVAALLAGGNR